MRTAHPQRITLNCVEMKHRIQRRIASETKGMTPAQRLVYYRKLVEDSPFAGLLGRGKRTRPAA